ncbi:MAG: ferrous iron transport protein A [Microscillaceae bacterium]|nr:ferrous iron transport protein A [Microscillaceae bacterium]
MKTLADLKKGESGTIRSFSEPGLSLKLLEMGFLPNSEVYLCGKAPLGDPLWVRVGGYQLSLRKAEAATVFLEA